MVLRLELLEFTARGGQFIGDLLTSFFAAGVEIDELFAGNLLQQAQRPHHVASLSVQVGVLDLHRALERFAEIAPRPAQLVELRYVGGGGDRQCRHLVAEPGRPVRPVDR